MYEWIPGSNLLKQAWDATKLAGTIKYHKNQRALALQQKSKVQIYRREAANKKFKELVEGRHYYEVATLFLPSTIVNLFLNFNEFFWKTWDVYWLFVLLRILSVFSPQSGYIHPDEFFQSLEIFSEISSSPWEFNSTAPLRSVSLPLFLWYLPLQVSNSYFRLVAPRFIICLLSFAIDYSLYKICLLHRHNYNICLSTLASSYVILVFGTRTFSNTIEMILCSLLLYLVSHCMKRSQETIFLQYYLDDKSESLTNLKEKILLSRKRKMIPPHNFKYSIHISFLLSIGVFNRPSFGIFAFIPLFYWFQRNISSSSYALFTFRFLSLFPVFICSSFFLVLVDSLYYGDLTLFKLWNLSMEWKDWKLTPLHFILYNIVPGNLAKHGSHPFWWHSLVNIPLLFGPLGIVFLYSSGKYILDIFSKHWTQKPSLRNAYSLHVFTSLFSLCLFSFFSHQEPRFLIPLLLPIVLCYSHILRFKIMRFRPLLNLWYLFNLSAFFFYGFAHQGGVTPMIQYIGNRLIVSEGISESHFVFTHTYMPPKFLLLGQEQVNFIDLAGSSLNDVQNKCLLLASTKDDDNYIIMSPRIARHLKSLKSLEFIHIHSVGPHVSIEDPPSWRKDFNLFYEFTLSIYKFNYVSYQSSKLLVETMI